MRRGGGEVPETQEVLDWLGSLVLTGCESVMLVYALDMGGWLLLG